MFKKTRDEPLSSIFLRNVASFANFSGRFFHTVHPTPLHTEEIPIQLELDINLEGSKAR